ncbi:MAG: response regulator, partial [Phaeodactylibacter sp.]|nr:response regulator [Phaeodactylibacter sp.]
NDYLQTSSHLLIVEDNSDVRAYLKTLLERKYKIQAASDGEAGIEKALATVPDLIISDVMMPKRDGFELCRVLKSDRRTSHIPIILLTARADVESRLAGLSQGADAYLAKPFDQRELDIQLQKALELRKALQEKYSKWVYTLPTGEQPPGLDAQFMEQARQVIESNLDNPDFGITTLYQALGVSRTQCFRKFKALTGTTPAEVIRQYRLEFARNLLANQELNISQAAYQSGFKDPAYFARAFQKAYGVSPSEFRNKTAN